ncbi:hypothetical protein CMUS01_04956 [Colletotrichum musicola]|uniref:Uncharacterized protein n=1 Tax=Colletotrichum musicola TaxID=2175873 RepID=A0A8H6KVG3_9PEZI|nr:hypothetical protein CMUS01_04956 [Colletotrichum musicola]
MANPTLRGRKASSPRSSETVDGHWTVDGGDHGGFALSSDLVTGLCGSASLVADHDAVHHTPSPTKGPATSVFLDPSPRHPIPSGGGLASRFPVTIHGRLKLELRRQRHSYRIRHRPEAAQQQDEAKEPGRREEEPPGGWGVSSISPAGP